MQEWVSGTLREAAFVAQLWLERRGWVVPMAAVSQKTMRNGSFSLLVCGAGRSGTSLLGCLLDGHHQLEVDFEHSGVASLMGQEVMARPGQIYQARVRNFLRACHKQAALHPDKYYGNKITTEQLFGLEDHNAANPFQRIDILDRFFNGALVGVKIIFILRDGRTCVRSKTQRTEQSVQVACERWKYSVQVYKFLQQRHRNNICIRYEDLVARPEFELTRICDFLNLSFDPGMMAGTTNKKMPEMYKREKIDPATLSLERIPTGCEELIRNELEECGYL